MAKEKATITLDRTKVEAARTLIGGRSVSEVIDVALGRLIRNEQLRRDVEAYSCQPPTGDEIALADLPVSLDLDDDDVDYETHYGQQ
ncbi:MAG: hypothetical protein ACR2G7_10605 [Acidimicrobiales bacterium]